MTDPFIGRIASFAVSRRAFLATGPAVAALTAVGAGPGLAAPCRSLHLAGAGAGQVALGYWLGAPDLPPGHAWSLAEDGRLVARGEDDAALPEAGGTSDDAVLAAESLHGGDPLFLLRGARLAIHGLMAAPGSDLARLSPMALDVDYDPGRGWRHAAWQFDRGDGLVHQSGALALEVPPGPSAGLALAFRVGEQGAEQRVRLSLAPLTAGHGLRRGIYLATWSESGAPADPRALALVAEPAADQEVAATAYRLAWRNPLLRDEPPVALALSVDYADRAPAVG